MAIIRDIMPAFELFQPATTEDALSLLDQYGDKAWVLAGGLDSFDWQRPNQTPAVRHRPKPNQRTPRNQTT